MPENDKKAPEHKALIKTGRIKAWLAPLGAVGVLMLIVTWMAGLFGEKISPGLNDLEDARSQHQNVMLVREQSITVFEPVPGSVEAKFATLVSSRLLARITHVHARAGDSVKKGQVLVSLEKTDLEAKAEQAKEHSRAIKARLTEAEQSLVRVEKLSNQRLVAMADLDRARANHKALVAELARASQLEQEAAIALGYTDIRAPIDGRLVERFAEPGDTATPGTPLLSLYNPLSLRVEAHVREQLALSLNVGQSLQVSIPSLKKKLAAVIEEIVPAADTGSRSFMVKVRIEYEKSLLPGMYARMLIPSSVEKMVVIPESWVVQVGQLNLVWVERDGQRVRRFIRLGKPLEGGRVQVLAGLSEGERLLTPTL